MANSHIFDYLRDIVAHTSALGNIDLVKVVGTDEETSVFSLSDDRTVVLNAKCKTPVPEFIGTFGMPNLGRLNTILNIPEYKEGASAKIVKRTGTDILAGIHFENKTKDFVNDYRFMATEIVNEKIKSVKFRGAKWVVEFEPTNNSIQRFKYQASAITDVDSFIATTTDSGDLEFSLGDHSSHAGKFVFESGVKGSITTPNQWPTSVFLSILGLPGDKRIRFSDQEGAATISVDSGLIDYEYIVLAKTK